MITRAICRCWIISATILFAIGSVPCVQAQSGHVTSRLEEASMTLAQIQPNYHGHRVRAMNHIRAAIIIMGGRNTGKRQQHTAKTRSEADAKLRTALGLISQSSGLSTRAQNHVDKAVEQLSLALSSK